MNSIPHAFLELVLALQRALPAGVQVRSSLVEVLSTLQLQTSSNALPAAGQLVRLSLSTRVWSTQRRLSDGLLLAAQSIAEWLSTRSLLVAWSTAQTLSIPSLSADWSTVQSLSTLSLSAEQSTVVQQSAELVQTDVAHRAALSDV